jgi:hypothetical protein
MADYYPLIARAIAGLDPSAPGEARRALYERARSALIAQLRSVQPPLSESEITRERLSLEEAVRKVESEAAQRAREASRSGPRAGDAFRAGTPRANPARPGEPPARARQPIAPQPPQQRNLRVDPPPIPPGSNPQQRPQPPQPSVGMQDPTLPPSRERSGAPRRRPSQQSCAKNLCQRAVALARIRPARAEHGEPRRRSRPAIFL